MYSMQKVTQISVPAIFFPGTQCDERIFIPLWQQLQMQCRSYVPLQWAGTLQEMLALSDDRVHSFDEKVHLIGYSMGGYVAALTAFKHPEKVHSLTLTCYDPDGLTSQEEAQRQALIKAMNSNNRNYFNADNLQNRLAKYLTAGEITNEQFISVLAEMESDLGPAVLKAHIQATTPRRELSKALVKSRFPIHFITAEHDKIAAPDSIHHLARQCANASYTKITQTAHMLPLTRPVELAQVLADKLI